MSFDEPSLLERMQKGEFLISVQVDPPSTSDISEFQKNIEALKRIGVWLIDVNSSRRQPSCDSIQLSGALSLLGYTVIPHVTTRDSSINGLLNQVLAAYSWSTVRNFLVITGDPYEARHAVVPSYGRISKKEKTGVFHTNAIGALEVIDKHLRKDARIALDITLAAAVNQNSSHLKEGKRLARKQSSGADFFMSQPVFGEAGAKHLFDFYSQHSTKPLLVGVWPLLNIKTIDAIYGGSIVGVALSQEIYQETRRFRDNEEGLQKWGIEQTLGLIEYIRKSGKAQGVYIVAPTRNPLILVDLLKRIF